MKKRSFLAISIVLMVASVTLMACSSSPPKPVEITINMSEYEYSPKDIELQVGQEVTLIFNNNGSLDHEFMVGRNVSYMGNVPNGFEIDFFEHAGVEPHTEEGMAMDMDPDDGDDHEHEEGEDNHDDGEDMDGMDMGDDGHMDHVGFMVMVPTGVESTKLTFTVTPEMVGEWEIGCFLLEGIHYNAGMQGTLTVIK